MNLQIKQKILKLIQSEILIRMMKINQVNSILNQIIHLIHPKNSVVILKIMKLKKIN